MGLREANQYFSRAIRAVRRGGEVTLTERGRPIAVIRPLTPPRAGNAALERMAEEGLLRLAQEPGVPRPGRGVRLRGEAISRTLRRERDER
jgi:prevent-host-death family protein